MRNLQHAAKLGEGPRAWNAWRRENPAIVPDLNDLDLSVGRRQFGAVQGGPIDLSGAELCRADLEHATLIEANLKGAALILADLSHARMMRADLRGANLSHAHLDHADLKDAQLDAAILSGTQLQHARNLTQAQIDRAHGDASTGLPPKLAVPKSWLKGERTNSSQVAKQAAPRMDPRADPFAVLGVAYGASIQEVRAAYLKLVKELHPDGRLHDPIASERLKAINKAYHDLKVLQRRAAATKPQNRFSGRPGVLFGVGFLASSMAMAVVFAGLYYTGSFRPNENRPTAAGATRVEPPPTGSISEHATNAGEKREGQDAATVQPAAAHVDSIRNAADDAAWAEAEREGTSIALHRYLGRYPEGRHAPRAAADLVAVVNSEVALDKAYDGRDAPAAEAAKLALRRYLDVYPNGRFADEVRSKLKAIDAAQAALLADTAAWAEAERNATSETLRAYLEAFPDGNRAAKAQRAVAMMEAAEARQRADRTAWTKAEQAGTTEALRGYLDAHPDGDDAATARQALAAIAATEARQRADRIAWAEVQQDGTEQALRRYLDAFPDGNNTAEARQRLASLAAAPEAAAAADSERVRDDAAWSKAQRLNTKSGYAAYLSAHPSGRHAKTARVSIAELQSLASKAGPVAHIKGSKPAPQGSGAGAADAPMSQRWPSADEPFIGADGRLRQR